VSVPQVGPSDVAADLEAAKALVELGVPVFACRLDKEGNPMPPEGWEKTVPNRARVDRWRPGMALCAVTGVVYDVIDIDPRNGGKASLDRMSEELGDDGPEVYWRVKTPSGGLHLYVASLGIRKCKPMPGIDYQAGDESGGGRGFVFLPPTVRPSRVSGEPTPYVQTNGMPQAIGQDEPSDRLREYIEERQADRPERVGVGVGRQQPNALRAACLGAPAGAQRDALLRYVHELERKGYDPDDIVALCMDLTLEMPTYDINRPWQRKDIKALLHRSGSVIPDATPREMAELNGVKPITAGLIQWASEIEEITLEWLWAGYLAFRELTLLDGEKGMGKSSICDDLIARATTGRPMPGSDSALVGPINVMVFTDEGHSSILKKRLKAAGADLTRVAFSLDKRPAKKKKGERAPGFVQEEWELALPGGAPNIGERIRQANAQLVIFDPITDYLESKISTNNDASVRQALRPLAGELGKAGASGLALRHMNKNKAMEAKFRGGGTTAFQNRSRVHLVVGELPASAGLADKYGLAMVDSNLTVKKTGVLTYSVVNSEVPLDDQGNMVGRCQWGEYADVESDVLTNGEGKAHGPKATAQPIIREILDEMFKEKDVWLVPDAKAELAAAGYTDHKTYDKVVNQMSIRKFSVPRRGGGRRYFWTTRLDRVTEVGEGTRGTGKIRVTPNGSDR
jgi:AAA domain/Bifunctional DNA primase/polymerase, N-terminal